MYGEKLRGNKNPLSDFIESVNYKIYLLLVVYLLSPYPMLAYQGPSSIIELHDGDSHLAIIRQLDYFIDTTCS